ncbi:hypothetical protein BC940DRAFT_303704 [Gongronella butleri]|nr:hypothetical protein BC940DRAFT_303704 [Gongronella butleri]
MAGEDTVVNFVIGVFVSLGASFMDALGLNILKLDHVREGNKPTMARRGDCGRPLWHIGLYTYISSQLIGSTIALNYLKTQWVAPLGSVALIYNFIFAKILVGTNITRKDVFGTFVVVASVIWIVVFGGMYNGEDPEASISLETLKTLFTRPIFIIYFSILNLITFAGLGVAIWSSWAITEPSKRAIFPSMTPKKMRKMVGLMFSLEGGLLASETLLLAKSGVKLFTLSITSQVNQFTDNISRFIILALLVTAVLQVYCLNTALKLYTSVVVVPVFYGTYTALGLVNTIIYLDEISNYSGWTIALVFVGIGVLIYGVYLLSSKTDPTQAHDDDDDDNGNDEHNGEHDAAQQQLQQSRVSHDVEAATTTASNANHVAVTRDASVKKKNRGSSSSSKHHSQQMHQLASDHEMLPLNLSSSASTSSSATNITNMLIQPPPPGIVALPPPPLYEEKNNYDENSEITASTSSAAPTLIILDASNQYHHHQHHQHSLHPMAPYQDPPNTPASPLSSSPKRWFNQWRRVLPSWPKRDHTFFSLHSTQSNTTTSTSLASSTTINQPNPVASLTMSSIHRRTPLPSMPPPSNTSDTPLDNSQEKPPQ